MASGGDGGGVQQQDLVRRDIACAVLPIQLLEHVPASDWYQVVLSGVCPAV